MSIDTDYMLRILRDLLAIPSPVGMTGEAVAYTQRELEALGVPCEVTRRGALAGHLGPEKGLARAFAAHLDTLGAMIRDIASERPLLTPLGSWSARFAEGARCTVFPEDAAPVRGTILPKLASGHAHGRRVDDQPVNWDQLVLRLDADGSARDLGVAVGDSVAIDPQPEFLENGFIVSRHVDDKAGVASLLAAVKSLREAGEEPVRPIRLLFAVSEEVGGGAAHLAAPDIAEFIAIDIAVNAEGQNSHPDGVTIAMKDASGPFDRKLSLWLAGLCREADIPHGRDVFRHYFSDAKAAQDSGLDAAMALICFTCDSSHGYERTHLRSLTSLARLCRTAMLSAT